jgi:hypothetical protein
MLKPRCERALGLTVSVKSVPGKKGISGVKVTDRSFTQDIFPDKGGVPARAASTEVRSIGWLKVKVSGSFRAISEPEIGLLSTKAGGNGAAVAVAVGGGRLGVGVDLRSPGSEHASEKAKIKVNSVKNL